MVNGSFVLNPLLSCPKQRWMAFGFAGAAGFVVDVLALTLCMEFVDEVTARALAFWMAASTTWWLNRKITFNERKAKQWTQQWLQSLTSASIAFVPNVGIYALLLSYLNQNQMGTGQWLFPYLAMLPGIAVGMMVNYWLADRWVFAGAERP